MFFQIVLWDSFREQRHFHVEIAQRRLRNVQKSVMHVQSCCFANLNLLFFCRSRCRRRRRCLSSLMSHIVYFNTTLVKYILNNMFVLMPDYPQAYSLGVGRGTKALPVSLPIPTPTRQAKNFLVGR